jgi:hypothetical protein
MPASMSRALKLAMWCRIAARSGLSTWDAIAVVRAAACVQGDVDAAALEFKGGGCGELSRGAISEMVGALQGTRLLFRASSGGCDALGCDALVVRRGSKCSRWKSRRADLTCCALAGPRFTSSRVQPSRPRDVTCTEPRVTFRVQG